MMSWKNYSIKGWHIDHIRACSKFDLSDEKQQKECFSFRKYSIDILDIRQTIVYFNISSCNLSCFNPKSALPNKH